SIIWKLKGSGLIILYIQNTKSGTAIHNVLKVHQHQCLIRQSIKDRIEAMGIPHTDVFFNSL
ncbi:MAG: hypothetical protein ACOCRK_10790, partial [bacterium]